MVRSICFPPSSAHLSRHRANLSPQTLPPIRSASYYPLSDNSPSTCWAVSAGGYCAARFTYRS